MLLASGLLINNEYIRRHRTIHVVNACGRPVQVRVDDGPPQSVDDLGRLVVGEGKHRLRLSGAVDESHDVEVRAGFLDRWSSRPLWVLNPGTEAVLEESTIYYAENPRPSEHRTLAGQPFLAFTSVDYAFEDPPAQMRVERRSAEVVKTAVRWVRANDVEAFLTISQADPKEAVAFAERRLRREPDQTGLLKYYVAAGVSRDRPRVESFLRSGLGRRPVLVQWHRAYQSLAETGEEDEPLVGLYDGFLKAEPSSGVLLYLRGRIDPDWDRQDGFYRRAMEADPALPWPWMALGTRFEAVARWDECRRYLEKALELKIEDDQVREPLHVARLGAGEAGALAAEYRTRLASSPNDAVTMMLLCEALAASGRADQVEPEAAAWIGRQPPEMQAQAAGPVRAIALYQAGKLEQCEALCRETAPLRDSSLRIQALLGLGRAGEVAADGSFVNALGDVWTVLAVSLGLSLEGQREEADRWRGRAIQKLESLVAETRRTAKILGAAASPDVVDLERVFVEAEDKALVLAVLAERFPEKRAEYHAGASRFNVRRKSPYHLVRRAIESGAPAVP